MLFCEHNRQARNGILLLLALLLLGWFMPRVSAHEITPAIVDLTFAENGGYELAIRLNLEALMAGIEPEHSDTTESDNNAAYERLRALPAADLRRAFAGFEARFLEAVTVSDRSGQRQDHAVGTVSIPAVGDTDLARTSTVVLTSVGSPPEGDIVWSWDRRFGANIIRVSGPGGDGEYSAYLTDGAGSEPIPVSGAPEQTISEVIFNYLRIGFTHILPLGADHILFVVGLFLLSTAVRPLVLQITSFTVAHTITLALGFMGVIHIPPYIVEPLIAASIVYVAVENILTDRLQSWRTVVVFCFGLLHGLGFAGVLSEIGVSTAYFVTALLSFNLGVELGQLAVIAGCFIMFGWFRNKPWYRSAITIPASVVIGFVGAYWFVERVLAAT
jgi:hydrogenase/urease accessory protein HupE